MASDIDENWWDVDSETEDYEEEASEQGDTERPSTEDNPKDDKESKPERE